ncbi:MAG: YqgE/AlgH family protein [Acidimicrobiia bacterium]|nr:YqgE/AlgH family protein [Acidimicrobiia bacterium]
MLGTSVKGRLLVATPALGDGIFDRSVVLIIEHDDTEGAFGVVLNRPSTTDVEGALPEWARLAASPPVVFVGGPVSPEAAICLARVSQADAEGWVPVVGAIGALDLSQDVDLLAAAVDEVRLFAGYAGWTRGQLEDEIEAGAWFVVDALEGDVLNDDPDSLWQRVLRRQRGRLAMFAAYPEDPTTN